MAFTNYYAYPQNNPSFLNQQQRLQQIEMQYPQYQQQLLYPQQVQPQIPQYGLNGRIVDDIDNVAISEVSSDNNNPSIFLKRDQNEVYLKKYNSNGLIETVTYKRVNDKTTDIQTDKSNPYEDNLRLIQEQLNSMNEKLNKVLNLNVSLKQRNASKKEIDE